MFGRPDIDEPKRSLFGRFVQKTRQLAEDHPRLAITLGVSMAVGAALVPSPAQPAIVSLLVVKAATAVLPSRLRTEEKTPEKDSLLGKFISKVQEVGKKHPVLVGTLLVSATVGSLLVPVPTPVHAAVAGLVVRGTVMGFTNKAEIERSNESKTSLFGRFIGKVKSLASDHPKVAAVAIASAVVATTLAGTHVLSLDAVSQASTLVSHAPAAVHTVVPQALDHAAKSLSSGMPPHEALSTLHHHVSTGVHRHLAQVHHVATHLTRHIDHLRTAVTAAMAHPAVPSESFGNYMQTDFAHHSETLLHTTPSSLETLKHLDGRVIHELTEQFGHTVTAAPDPSHAGHVLLNFHAGEKVLTIPVDAHTGAVLDGDISNHIVGHDGVSHSIPVPEAVKEALHGAEEDLREYAEDDVSGPGF